MKLTFKSSLIACLLLAGGPAAVSSQIAMTPNQPPETFLGSGWLSVNNGPLPYRRDLDQGTPTTGDIGADFMRQANASVVAAKYHEMGVQWIRPNDLGGGFSLDCLFPVSNLSDIPDPGDVASDSRWNWSQADEVFRAMLRHRFAPYLKLASREWKSDRWNGLSYQTDGEITYVIPPKQLDGFCAPWPQIARIIMAIGDELVTTIVKRYNDLSRWAEDLQAGGMKPGPPLERSTWATTNPGAVVGVELQNEYSELRCLNKTVGDEKYTLEGWTKNCGGEPYTWSGHYWDGTPEQAWLSYASQAKAIRSIYPNVAVGGPANGATPTFGLVPNDKGQYPAGGAGLNWYSNFMKTVKDQGAPLDFFSWHTYTSCETLDNTAIDCTSSNPHSAVGSAATVRKLLDDSGFASTPMVISEINDSFGLNPGNAGPGTVEGASFFATTLARLSESSYGIIGASIVNGLDGAYLPGNLLSFPASNCDPEYKTAPKPGQTPDELEFTGRWVNDCAYGEDAAASINSASGMGVLYNNADMKPTGAMMTKFADLLGQELVSGLALDIPDSGGVVAVQSKEGLYSVMLSNAAPTPMPVKDLKYFLENRNLKVTKILDLKQHLRDDESIQMPNDIRHVGTVQVEGAWYLQPANEEPFVVDEFGVVLIQAEYGCGKESKCEPAEAKPQNVPMVASTGTTPDRNQAMRMVLFSSLLAPLLSLLVEIAVLSN